MSTQTLTRDRHCTSGFVANDNFEPRRMSLQDERYVFIAEWYDPNAALIRRYKFLYYPKDSTIEMYDIKNGRHFLKRSPYTIKLEDIYIGSTVNVNARQLKFVDYGDTYTERKVCSKKERTLGMIKPDAISKMGQIIDKICSGGFLITKMKMCRLDRNEAFQFYKEHQSKVFFDELLKFVTSGPVVAFELMGEDSVQRWRKLMGETDSSEARKVNPNTLRARFGEGKTRNAVHGSDSHSSAERELSFFFPSDGPSRTNTAKCTSCTCGLIKPHAVLGGFAGKIIDDIQDTGFEISALQMFHMEKANAEEFFEVYKGVVQEYGSMVDELTSGPCIAMEIRAKDAAQEFREMTGPADPEIARHLRPRTLRARYGKDKIQNAVHVTDLPEDGLLEVEYFFKILDR